MTVSEILSTQYTEGTVAAGDVNQPILSFNIKTENTEPVLTINKFSFITGGTFDKLVKATLYYTKRNSAFSTITKLGEIEITADAFEITVNDPVSLTEGDNYFWLTYDLSEKAVDGNIIDAGIVGVTCSDGEHLITNGNPEGNRIIKNEFFQ